MEFQVFGSYHMNYIYIMALFWLLVPLLSKKFLEEQGQRNVAFILVFAILGIELFDDFYRVFDIKGWHIGSDLPLHMCGFSVFATSWVLIKRNKLMFELCYFWGLGGALQAILTPDATGLVDHFYVFSFMVSHGLIILNVLYIIFVYGMVLREGALMRTIIITNVLMVPIALINYLIDANYFFLFGPPENTASPLILTDQFPYYFFNMELMAIAVLYIIYIPMIIYRKRTAN